jgi:flagellar basal-body rod protein FlgB
VLAANLANVDTPGYKARDFDFAAVLSGTTTAPGVTRTHARHLGAGAATNPPLGYRNPYQPARDGNTVEADMEFARFAENSIAYQASLMFVNGKISGLRTAITGR